MLPDILAPGLNIVFCGTAAGRASAARGHYYAGRGNRFWALLAEVGLTPRQLRPEEDYLMPTFGLGLTDLAKGVAGMDHEIPDAAFTPARLAEVMSEFRPKGLAFTSLKAGRTALRDRKLAAGHRGEDPRWPGTEIWILPSPSGAARGSFQLGPWREISAWARRARPTAN